MPSDEHGPAGRPGPAPADQDWFGGRRWTGIAALAVVLLIVVSAAVVILTLRGRHHTATAPATAPAPSAAAPAAASPLPTTVPAAAPNGTTWQLYQTVAVPTVAGVGPTHIAAHGAIATGYAHTPDGALVALVNEGLRYFLAPDAAWRASAAAMIAPGPGLAAWKRLRARNPYGPGGAAAAGPDGTGGSFSQIAGFQFVSYTPTDAAIQLLSSDPSGGFHVVTEHVTWRHGDWKLVLASTGGVGANTQPAASTAGFIAWKGV